MRLFPAFDRNRPALRGYGLALRHPEQGDYEAWRRLRHESSAFLVPWEPRWPHDDLTREGYRRRLQRYQRDLQMGVSVTWFIFQEAGQTLVGGLTYSSIRLGAARSAQLGYWMGEAYAGKGNMRRAVSLSLGEMFGPRGLERVEAACLPSNERSIRLLERLGFSREGRLRSYLEIDGQRRDHLLYALLRHEHDPQRAEDRGVHDVRMA